MSDHTEQKKFSSWDKLSRRDFLRTGTISAGVAGLSLTNPLLAATDNRARDVNCILLFLVGGPSQLDTWDPKPAAPLDVRGPFQPISTSIPGIHISENFPRMAALAQHYAIIRSVHHTEAPVHETGQQLLQTGHLSHRLEYPHYGAALSYLRGSRLGSAPFVILPGPLGNTGVNISHGQDAGFLGKAHQPIFMQPPPFDREPSLAERYGQHTFGQSCLSARRLVEQGVRMVTVNMFDTVFDKITWDCHADGGVLRTTLDDYRRTLCPMFDQAYSALLEDLHQRGLLENTLVMAMGEFGRTPRLNARGGRDHWPGVWSILLAGGGIRGGQVVGASDRSAAEPAERPVSPTEVAATIYHALGIAPQTRIPAPNGRLMRLVAAEPVQELFQG